MQTDSHLDLDKSQKPQCGREYNRRKREALAKSAVCGAHNHKHGCPLADMDPPL